MLTPVQKPFKYIYSRFHTLYRMGASQERAAFFNATLPVVPTENPPCPPALRAFLHFKIYFAFADFSNAHTASEP